MPPLALPPRPGGARFGHWRKILGGNARGIHTDRGAYYRPGFAAGFGVPQGLLNSGSLARPQEAGK